MDEITTHRRAALQISGGYESNKIGDDTGPPQLPPSPSEDEHDDSEPLHGLLTQGLRRSAQQPVGMQGTTDRFAPASQKVSRDTDRRPTLPESETNMVHAVNVSGESVIHDACDNEVFEKGYSGPPRYCSSAANIRQRRTSLLYGTMLFSSIYSTVLSGVWLVVSIVQPRWGLRISSSRGLSPSTATTVSALIAKTIELTFVTTFATCLGQQLSRRSLSKNAQGVSLAEMTMRNWVFQPGSLVTHAESVPSAGKTVLGILTLISTIGATLYTTASDAMVAPKLQYGAWERRELTGTFRHRYDELNYDQDCPWPLKPLSCKDAPILGDSYRNFRRYLDAWAELKANNQSAPQELQYRPSLTTYVFENITADLSWMNTNRSSVEQKLEDHGRIINDVSLAMPHPGVYTAATDDRNGMLQPADLADTGGYSIRAGVVSPVLNVRCANMSKEELAPLVYTEWPNAVPEPTGNESSGMFDDEWLEQASYEVSNVKTEGKFNKTTVDHVFAWGSKVPHLPPLFHAVSCFRIRWPPSAETCEPATDKAQFPSDNYTVVDMTIFGSTYILGKSPNVSSYALCEIKSWISTDCSSRLDYSGSGARLSVVCDDPEDEDRYLYSYIGVEDQVQPYDETNSWSSLAVFWAHQLNLGGLLGSSLANSYMLMALVLDEPSLPAERPSVAEALAVYAASVMIMTIIDSPLRHHAEDAEFGDFSVKEQSFNASVRSQQYTSGHTESWQVLFYAVLAPVFAINVVCLAYLLAQSGLVTDFTEPQNLFVLAVNSPPSETLKGSCGGGPSVKALIAPWRVAYANKANHFFFTDSGIVPRRKGLEPRNEATAVREKDASRAYQELSSENGWLTRL